MRKCDKLALLLIMALLLPYCIMNPHPINTCDDKTENELKKSNGESHTYDYNRTWGGGDTDSSYGITIDSLDNVYIVGRTQSFGEGNDDVALVKYDSDGIQLWNLTWGGFSWDKVYKGVDVDSSNNVYIVGATESFGDTSGDLFLRKYNSAGVLQWNITLGEEGQLEVGMDLMVDSYDNIYIAVAIDNSTTFGDVSLMKYNSDGVQIWNRTWGGTNVERAYGMTLDSLGNIYLTGFTNTYPSGVSDLLLLKYNSSGILQWNVTWGSDSYNEWGLDVAVDPSGDIYVSGKNGYYHTSVLVKFNNSGVQLWNKTWAPGYGFTSVLVDSSSDIYVAGNYITLAGDTDVVLVKYTSEGTQIWNQTWGGVQDEYKNGLCPVIALDSSENIYITGDTRSFGAGKCDFFLVKFKLDIEEPDIEDPIVISNPTDFTIEKGYTGVIISWTATDSNPGTYTIELQGTGVITGPTVWSSGVAITYNVPDGLNIGEYVYLVNFTDAYGNSVTHAITMTVKDVDSGGTNNITAVSGYNIISIIGIMGISSIFTIILIRKKFKK